MPETFVYRRWGTDFRGYVASSRDRLYDSSLSMSEELIQTPYLRAEPASETSTTLMSLPTEIRLRIYEYLVAEDNCFSLESFEHLFDPIIVQGTKYAYLYRSPRRTPHPNGLRRDVAKLFHICRKIREELTDEIFGDRRFVIEASFYQSPMGYPEVLPTSIGPTAFVRRLLLITVIELDDTVHGMTDLRPLQEMINLTELHIVFVATSRERLGSVDILELPNNPIQAVLECIPKRANVKFGTDGLFWNTQLDLSMHLFSLERVDHISPLALSSIQHNTHTLDERKGRLSGSRVNHSLCQYPTCLEGLDCVNSRLRDRLLPDTRGEAL